MRGEGEGERGACVISLGKEDVGLEVVVAHVRQVVEHQMVLTDCKVERERHGHTGRG